MLVLLFICPVVDDEIAFQGGGVLRRREDAVFAFDRLPELAEGLADAFVFRRVCKLLDGAEHPEKDEEHEQTEPDEGPVVDETPFFFLSSVFHLQKMYMSETMTSS